MSGRGKTVKQTNENRLLFVHGWGLDSGLAQVLFSEMQSPVTATGIDLPGYGRVPMIEDYTLDTLVQAVLGSVEQPVTLVGWSLGGMIAAWATILFPERVSRLVLINATPCFVEKKRWHCGMQKKIFHQFAKSAENNMDATRKRFLSLLFPVGTDAREGLRKLHAYVNTAPAPHADALDQGLELLAFADIRYRLLEISCPTLILHGTGDRLVPECAAREFRTEIEDARLEFISHGGHAPFLTRPRHTAGLIDAFLAAN
ncbi:MAG: hypothetical protein DSZ32_03525 [Gammaproteobacteria bacterium]|nr:MAG: hypothetical protein DSZ32_03525 [Gammaproteobacteria bacterium]